MDLRGGNERGGGGADGYVRGVVRFFADAVGASGTENRGAERISAQPFTFHGTACNRSSRIMASVILDDIAAGSDRAGILSSDPSLTGEDIDAALAYGAELAREGTVEFPLDLSVLISAARLFRRNPVAQGHFGRSPRANRRFVAHGLSVRSD